MDSPEFKRAVRMQKFAADPRGTRMASANAGSGKTRVLVDRVSRLLLTDTEPERILCLTYTKAAASEMQTRLFKTLGDWSIFPEADLNTALTELLPEGEALPPLAKARRLFAKALETPEGLKVQTIHAFCERILSRFPIEAGILPGFEPIDDADMRVLRDDIRDEIYRDAAKNSGGDLNKALQILTAEKADQTLDDLFKWISNSPDKIEKWAAAGVAPLAKKLGIPEDINADDVLRSAGKNTDFALVRSIAADMLGSPNKGDITAANIMLEACEVDDLKAAFDTYLKAFLTTKLTLLSRVVTTKAPDAALDFFAKDGDEVARVITAFEHSKAAQTLTVTRALLTVAIEYSAKFKRAKYERRGLDFNDQILLVRNLIKRSEVSDWIRYKLDGGIDHILVDEAQDTSPEQWEIIDALAQAFIQDDPDRDQRKPRTMFAVGDEKQSIYSFQGARPERFLDEIKRYVKGDDKAVSMRMSFRSSQDILDGVDAFLNGEGIDGSGALVRMFDIEDFPPAGDTSVHSAFRKDRGRIDLWPSVPRPKKDEENEAWDTRPVDAISQSDSREQLASAIAKKIAAWIDTGEPVYDREFKATRPIQAGDILILVRQRNAFFDAVIRNLKKERVPVAGADRLKLKSSIAVKDLLSLAQFALLPSDDLSLAEILKSPLIGWTEDELFDAAYGRDGSLWSAVKDHRPDTAETLTAIIQYSRRYAPYEFFARVLDMSDVAGESLMRKMFVRLGLEAKDAIEAFLARALDYQRRRSRSLQKFVKSFSADEQELKREMDSGTGQVRVMTVHGAKGLEAPVVFLPDTTQKPTSKSAIIPVGDGFALPPRSDLTPEKLKPYKEHVKDRMMQEYLRLLYVGMTRAESRLIICGFNTGQGLGSVQKESWYKEAKQAMALLDTRPLETEFGAGLTYGGVPDTPSEQDQKMISGLTKLPPWISRPAPQEPVVPRRVTPSHLLAKDTSAMPVRSPVSGQERTRFLRGNLIHKLLEILPELPAGQRGTAAKSMLASYDDIDTDILINEVFSVLDNPEFAAIFALGSRAEISMAGTAKGLPDHLYLNAQIDRISVTNTHVFVVDYKSNRPPPKTQDGVADIYWGQMAAYRELAREIYPGKSVTCALLWTDGPNLMILDEKRLDEALTQIAALPT